MALETRKNGKKYYYRKRRAGHRVQSIYVGQGEIARMLYEMALGRRLEALENRRELRELTEPVYELERNLDLVEEQIRVLVKAHMVASGYHRHKGQWRKKRNEKAA